MENTSFFETLTEKVKNKIIEYKVPLISTWVVGLLSYLYVFTNKLVNYDDIEFLFGKGLTTSLGRWGLDILSYIIPDFSMPWFHGVLTLLLMSIAVCVVISIFKIKSQLLQCMLAGLLVSFPSMTVLFAFMFTTSSYAVSILCDVLAVKLVKDGGKRNFILGGALFVFSISIYQAYISLAAGLFIVLLIQDILKNEKTSKKILTDGIRYLFFLGLFIVIYLGITKTVLVLFDTSFSEYVKEVVPKKGVFGIADLLKGIERAYRYLLFYFIPKNRVLNVPLPSAIMHIICLVIVIVKLTVFQIKRKNLSKVLLLLLCVILFPLCINCFYLFTFVYIMMLYGFVSFYILTAVVIQEIPSCKKKNDYVKDIVLVSFTVIILGNIYIANRFSLQMHLIYENAYSFYTSAVTQIKENPEFTEDTKIAIIGKTDNLLYDMGEFEQIYAVTDIINEYSRERFIKYYIGFDAEFTTREENGKIAETEEFINMPEYPYYGSVRKIDDCIVVKLGEY